MTFDTIISIILYSFISGITVFVGGVLSFFYEKNFSQSVLKQEISHTSMAFGGGIIAAAVSFVLVPQGMSHFNLNLLVIYFFSGSLFFFLLDRFIEQKGGTMAQLLSMLLDFVPESIALGAVFAKDHQLGLLLALFIGLQNLPEAFNSYNDLRVSKFTPGKTLSILFILSFSGVISALSGYYWLSNMPDVTHALMLFASGGILYLIFQDIAPAVKFEHHWLPPLGANLGFMVGMIGQKLLG